MNRTTSSFTCRRGALIGTAAVGLALLLVFSLALPCQAGPAQEKDQEKKEEKKAPKKYTNDDLRKIHHSSDSGNETGPPAAAEAPPAAGDEGGEAAAEGEEAVDPWDSVGVATDSQGRGEAYWRQAMTEAKAAVAAARGERDRLQSELKRNQVDFTAIDDPAARALVHQRIEELFGLLDEAKQKLSDAEQALSDLEEDARRSGALPGWLR